jgi:hypothetical protein
MRFEFPSIVNTEKNLFVFDTDEWRTAPVNYYFLVMEINNRSGRAVATPITPNLVGEYLSSLATAMLENEELSRKVYYYMPAIPENELMDFYSKIVYSEKKTRYYSTSSQKITAVKSKRWDKRWEEVREEMDGSPQSMFRMLTQTSARSDTLYKYVIATGIRTWLYNNRKRRNKFYMDDPAELVGWTKNYDEMSAIRCAYDAVMTAIQIYRAKLDFKNKIDGFTQHAMITKLEE